MLWGLCNTDLFNTIAFLRSLDNLKQFGEVQIKCIVRTRNIFTVKAHNKLLFAVTSLASSATGRGQNNYDLTSPHIIFLLEITIGIFRKRKKRLKLSAQPYGQPNAKYVHFCTCTRYLMCT